MSSIKRLLSSKTQIIEVLCEETSESDLQIPPYISPNSVSRTSAFTYDSKLALNRLFLRWKRDRSRPVGQGPTLGTSHVTQSASLGLILDIRKNIIGEGVCFHGPYGKRRLTYVDYTASGRCLATIEDYIRWQVMPFYANTHSEASKTGSQTIAYRENARQIIKNAVNAGPDDALIFLGSGSTAAIDRLVSVLGLRDTSPGRSSCHTILRPVVFVGPFEHHSNELPWRESLADVVRIKLSAEGNIDQVDLEHQLVLYKDRPLRIGSFSAASNVTGIRSRILQITALLHRHGGLAFWDFAAAAPYLAIDMNPAHTGDDERNGLYKIDAVFISPHKFIGGPGTPGVLVAKKALFSNAVPSVPGGGTVSFVTPETHEYVTDIEHREEGGTPAIIESIRAGLVFQLKERVGSRVIQERETEYTDLVLAHWTENPRITILGSLTADRLPIISFLVKSDERTYLHHNFVASLLNDLFGIQARAGCSCAGPYGHSLLGISKEMSKQFTDAISLGLEGLKPGWVRVNFNYFVSRATVNYVLRAVDFIAEHGKSFLRDYNFDLDTGVWTHHKAGKTAKQALRSLSLNFVEGAKQEVNTFITEAVFPHYLTWAERSLAGQRTKKIGARSFEIPESYKHLLWFAT